MFNAESKYEHLSFSHSLIIEKSKVDDIQYLNDYKAVVNFQI